MLWMQAGVFFVKNTPSPYISKLVQMIDDDLLLKWKAKVEAVHYQ